MNVLSTVLNLIRCMTGSKAITQEVYDETVKNFNEDIRVLEKKNAGLLEKIKELEMEKIEDEKVVFNNSHGTIII